MGGALPGPILTPTTRNPGLWGGRSSTGMHGPSSRQASGQGAHCPPHKEGSCGVEDGGAQERHVRIS